MNEPFVHKIFTGKVKEIGDPDAALPMDKPWKTGMFKKATDEQIWLGKTGLKGDEVADTKNHGGPEKALFAYPIKHYDYWKQEFAQEDDGAAVDQANKTAAETIDIGAMGENLAVLEMDEFTVCIGDTYKFGDAIIQVSQPRQPCWKPARRFGIIDFALRIQNSGRTGWYFRVLQEGYVISKIDLELIDRPYPQWTIAACNEVMHVYKENFRLADELASCDLLAENWKRTLNKRLRGQISSIDKRVFGPNREEH